MTKTEVVRELIESYERFDVYKTYFVVYNEIGQVIETKPRWNETVPKRKVFKSKTLVQQVLDSMSEKE